MYYFNFPSDVKDYISHYVRPEKFTPEGVKSCARTVFLLQGSQKRMRRLKRVYELTLEYSKYNHHAESEEMFWRRTRLSQDKLFSKNLHPWLMGSPQLFAALSTGHCLFDRNFRSNHYTPKLEEDIKEIIETIPESLNFIFGDSNTHAGLLTPLSMACLNQRIPLHMIEFLIDKGASLKVPCKATGKIVLISSHLGFGSMNSKRLKDVKEILDKYLSNA